MQPALEFRHALLSAPTLSVPFTFPGADPILTKPLTGIVALGAAISKLVNRSVTPPEETMFASRPPEGTFVAPGIETLAQLAGQGACGELVGCLWADLQGVKRDLLRGHTDGNLEIVRSATPKLIALAGTVGAKDLLALARAIKAVAEAGDVSDQRFAVDRAIALTGQLVTQVEALRAVQDQV